MTHRSTPLSPNREGVASPIDSSSLVNQTVFRERACASERGRGGRENTLVNQTVFRERACASERGRGGRENTVWPNSPGLRGHDKILS